MAETKLEKLFFTIMLIDKVTLPAGKVEDAIQKMYKSSRRGFEIFSKGAQAVQFAFSGINTLTDPAREFAKAIEEVRSLGVPEDELQKLDKASKGMAMRLGINATDIVRSAHDIQAAIPGLAKGTLSAFASSSSVLAKATQTDPAVVTEYYRTLYNTFRKEADSIGADTWAMRLAERTSKAVEMLNTTGPKMAVAMSKLGTSALGKGVSEAEQLAVLGMVQSTVSPEESALQYQSFLDSVGKANGALKGLLRDDGSLKPTYEMIAQIESQTAKMGKQQRSDFLQKAFGSKKSVGFVENLFGKSDRLMETIETLERIDGMDNAIQKAQGMAEPFDRFSQTLKVVRIVIGETLLPVMNTVLLTLAEWGAAFVRTSQEFPALKWAVGLLSGALFTLTSVFGVLWSVMGLYKICQSVKMNFSIMRFAILKMIQALRTSTLAHKTAIGVLWLWNNALNWTAVKTKVLAAVQWVWNGAIAAGKAFSGALAGSTLFLAAQFLWLKGCALLSSAATWVLNGGFIALGASLWGVVAALWATGIPEIILIIAALIGVVIAAVYWWDEWTGALITFGKWCWDGVISAFQTLCGWFDSAKSSLGAFGFILGSIPILGQIMQIRDLCGWISELWNESESFTDFLKNVFFGTVEAIWSPFREFFGWLSNAFDAVPGMFSELSFLWDWIPGLNASGDLNITEKTKPESLTVQEGKRLTVTGDTISNRTNSTYINVGSVNARNGISPAQLQEYAVLQ